MQSARAALKHHTYLSAFHGARTYFLAMIPGTGKNNTCNVGRDDPFGTSRPQRDVRLQIYISLTLGLGAFMSFCASLPYCTARCNSSNQSSSYSAHVGKAYMLRARSRTISPLLSPTSPTVYSAGLYRYGRLPTRRCWLQQVWMPTYTSRFSKWL
jgi:hypothetical protein